MDRYRVNVLGWYDHANCGDEAYKLAFPNLFPEYDFTFSDRVLDGFDGYVLGGGDTVNEFFLNSLLSINRPKQILSATIPDNIDPSLFKQFRVIGARDNDSLKTLSSKGLKGTYTPDFGLRLTGNAENGKRIIQEVFREENHELYSKVVGVVINSHLAPQHGSLAFDYARFEHFCYEMAKLMDHTCASFLFIPFGYRMPWDDRAANAMMANRCKFWKKNTVVYRSLTVSETLDVVSGLDALISTRLHSSIFACSNRTPFLDITHNHKNKRLLDTLNYSEASILYNSFSFSTAHPMLNRLLEQKNRISRDLQNIVNTQAACLDGVALNVRLV